MGSSTSPAITSREEMQKMGLMAYDPSTSRVECLTICRHHSKGSTVLSYSKTLRVGKQSGA